MKYNNGGDVATIMINKFRRFLNEHKGMSLIELLIGVFVLATLTMAVVGLATLGTKTAFNNELLAQAQAIANEKAEIIRALPYDSVGYTDPADCANKEANGITYNYCEPDGIIQRTEDVIRDNVTYTVTTIISLVDDQENGYLTKNTAPVLPMSVAHAQSTPTLDETTADYKQGEVAVSIPSTKATQQTVQVGWISADDALACADSSDCPGVDVCCSEQCVEPCLDENLP
ncbi:MAG: hypothetical protein U1C49_00465, partial [Candidatus Andersenbacteria bacterium]|nr:hypothetical protein [Candidatus Andersenbacteria bacterium]